MFSLNFPSRRKSALAAFTLIELAIVLGVVGVVGGGLWRLMSSSGQQTKDAATASQQGALINAVKGYLSSTEGQTWMGSMAASINFPLPLPTSNTSVANCKANAAMVNNQGFCDFLPANFTTTTSNPYGQTYLIRVLKDATAAPTPPVTYAFMIIASGGPLPIPDANGGRISNLIGGDGGFIYSTTVCSATAALAPTTVCGALGAWQDITGTYGFGAYTGAVASRTFVSATTNSSLQWLSRIPDPTVVLNTMTTDLVMGTWQGTAVTTISGSATAPAIQLQNGHIYGDGSAAGDHIAQILITQPKVISEDVSAPAPIQVSAGCSIIGIPSSIIPAPFPADPACVAPALNVGYGDVFVGGQLVATKIFSASDARLKTDILPLKNALNDIMNLSPVTYRFNGTKSKSMGLLAQDLEKVYPDLVTNTNGRKYVEYNGLVSPLIGAVQELKQQNDALRNQLHEQSAREDKLEQELRNLESKAP